MYIFGNISYGCLPTLAAVLEAVNGISSLQTNFALPIEESSDPRETAIL